MSFGISVGDFVTCLILLKDVAQALNKSTGSISDFKQLTQTLKSLENALITSELIYQQWEQLDSASPYKEPHKAVLNGIKFERQQCKEILENFMKNLKPYTDAFTKDHSKALMRRVRMVMWAVKKDDTSKLNRDLEGHLKALQIYGEVLAKIQADENAKRAAITGIAVDGILSNSIEMRAEFTAMSNYIRSGLFRMPLSLGYPWERDATVKGNVLLHDAIGRKVLLPMVLMSTPSVLHDTLMLMYRGLPGRKRIVRKEYTITDEDADGTLIEETGWAGAIRQGMQIALQVNLPASPSLNIHRCPRCDEPSLGNELPDQRRRCQKCQLTFRIFDQERIIEEPECTPSDNSSTDENCETSGNISQNNPKSSSVNKSTANKDSRRAFRNLKNIDDDDYHFQSVHYYRDVQSPPIRSKVVSEKQFIDVDDLPPLHLAAAKGQTADITLLLSDGANVNVKYPLEVLMRAQGAEMRISGCSPLHMACLFDKMRAVDVLLSNGANIDAVDSNGAGIISYAIYGESRGRMVLPLLSRGASENIKEHFSEKGPIHDASVVGISWLMYVFVERGVDANDRNHQSWTPMHFAAQAGHKEVVQVLLEQGADMNITENAHGWKPLHLASYLGSEAVVEILLQNGAFVDDLDSDGDTPLHLACMTGHEGIIRALLAWEADTSAQGNGRGSTPLHEAAYFGATGSLKQLLDCGANILAVDKAKESVLSHAVRGGNYEGVQFLLNHGGDAKVFDDQMMSPLMQAASSGYGHILELLLEHGAEINDIDVDGWSSLHCAASQGNEVLVEILIIRGAEINHQDKWGRTALHYACDQGHELVVKILADHGAESLEDEVGDMPLYRAAFRGHEVLTKMLITRGAEINHQDKRGCTALYCACLQGHEQVVKVLLDQGAESFEDESGFMPLHCAALAGKEVIVELLLNHGVDLSAKSTEYGNNTALFCAAATANSQILELLLGHGAAAVLCDKNGNFPWNFHLPELDGKYTNSFFNILLRHGWDINEQDGAGCTVLHYAAGHGNEAVTKLLISLSSDLFIQDKDGDVPLYVSKNDSIVRLILKAMREDQRFD